MEAQLQNVYVITGHYKGVEQSTPLTLRYIEGLMHLIKCQSPTLIHDRIQWKHCNPETLNTIKSIEF